MENGYGHIFSNIIFLNGPQDHLKKIEQYVHKCTKIFLPQIAYILEKGWFSQKNIKSVFLEIYPIKDMSVFYMME